MAKAPKKEKTPPSAEDEVVKKGRASDEIEISTPKGGGRLKLILVVVLAMAVGGAGAFAALKFMGPSLQPQGKAAESEAAPAPQSESDEAPPEAPKRAEHGEAKAESGAESGHGGGEAASGGGGHGGGAEAPAEPAGPQNIEFKPFIVNLNDVGGKRFLKLTMSIEAETQELTDEINLKMPQFRDVILLLLSSLSYDDIATLDGKMRLRNQMLNRINAGLTKGKTKNIYFSEFVVQ
jgi:flagellar FliL protein